MGRHARQRRGRVRRHRAHRDDRAGRNVPRAARAARTHDRVAVLVVRVDVARFAHLPRCRPRDRVRSAGDGVADASWDGPPHHRATGRTDPRQARDRARVVGRGRRTGRCRSNRHTWRRHHRQRSRRVRHPRRRDHHVRPGGVHALPRLPAHPSCRRGNRRCRCRFGTAARGVDGHAVPVLRAVHHAPALIRSESGRWRTRRRRWRGRRLRRVAGRRLWRWCDERGARMAGASGSAGAGVGAAGAGAGAGAAAGPVGVAAVVAASAARKAASAGTRAVDAQVPQRDPEDRT